jgi:hypothetical protein
VNEPRFCQQCGQSLVPLAVPHVSRQCAACAQTVYLANQAPDNKGILVEKGDTFTLPSGWLTISLDPSKSKGSFTRSGVNWFVEFLITSRLPADPSKVEIFLRDLDKEADEAIRNSSRMPGVSPESEADMHRFFEAFKDDRDTIEWRAIMLSVLTQHSLKMLVDDNCSKEELAFEIARTLAAQVMLVYKQSLEAHIWAGYEQTRLVYDVASAGASTPTEAKAIEALRPAFESLSEDVLAAWVGGNTNVSDKLGVKGIDEDVVNALARFHLAQFERKRQEAFHKGDAKSHKRGNLIAAAAAGAAVASAIIAMLGLLGVFSSSQSSTPSTPTPTVSSSLSKSSAHPTISPSRSG